MTEALNTVQALVDAAQRLYDLSAGTSDAEIAARLRFRVALSEMKQEPGAAQGEPVGIRYRIKGAPAEFAWKFEDHPALIERIRAARSEDADEPFYEVEPLYAAPPSPQVRTEADANERDAERYRWLRMGPILTVSIDVDNSAWVRPHSLRPYHADFPTKLDSAIDAAIGKMAEKPSGVDAPDGAKQ